MHTFAALQETVQIHLLGCNSAEDGQVTSYVSLEVVISIGWWDAGFPAGSIVLICTIRLNEKISQYVEDNSSFIG